ncbi:sugar nucleotide-binding protein [Pedobacter sp. HMF7647]|uniref:dTDP-4-dehydrorhamnose reductase n=1 Tax=Hufsiella arboris TaxID=2695275 RepID=A0A7K1Y9F9_9SPHI|nr:SDR family oxidoreductase [Hufsiella arboris]MXV50739.1 sugar nucleotide-binding protein [Hufsiella arboris]
MKKVLVTGSNGLLGQKITEHILKTQDFELLATSKGANRFPVKTGYSYCELDISDDKQLKSVIEDLNPDVIINTAAVTNVDKAESDKEQCRKLNINAVESLVSICENLNIHLIHLSTDFVFDGQNGPYDEDADANPLSYYGQSKFEAEEILKASSCQWTIIRTILVYGIVPDMSRTNIVLWAKSSLEDGRSIKVVNDQWRMPTLAEDLANACLYAAQNGITGLYNVSGKDSMSIVEIVYAVADYWNLDKSLITPVSSETLNQEAKRPARTGFILDKAIDQLNYRPHSFEEGLEVVEQQLLSLKNSDIIN